MPAEEGGLGWIALAEQEDHVEQEDPKAMEDAKCKELSINNVQWLQREDPDLQPLIHYLKQQELPDNPKLSQHVILKARQMDLNKDSLLQHFWWTQ
ncbi:uncharacterized protein ACA1_080690 [Acanthamoeba castellanii str. Neff]|uniref:Uncharacterized protein n=1 Tax=Acanthamoeba castellanii (strain ATCC 30010 / Neff) TaxID=1257118 RepID=L8HBQ5_ACACF|nr:uncharacterized protein ACA1_080690 [Acanthamoeba castellanii str. Neff]ELR22672.1 hypothetical protein ACA1_080690 [Acanthamoeba castellanii str. Neff]